MEEFADDTEVLSDKDYAIVIKNGIFNWNVSSLYRQHLLVMNILVLRLLIHLCAKMPWQSES